MKFLVGDNPFHGISHLSQERSRARGDTIKSIDHDAQLVLTSLANGADGFMFSVSETTLSILEVLRKDYKAKDLPLYAIVPYAYEYVRLATQSGGILGLATHVARNIAFSGNIEAMATGAKGLIRMDVQSLLKTYLIYEISRIRSSIGKQGSLCSLMLHELITEITLSLDLDWLVRSFVDFMLKRGISPGFETRNFPLLVSKLRKWKIDLKQITIATPFNRVGFQMNPSKIDCEKTLAEIPESNVIAMSILAAGYLRIPEAVEYVRALPNLKGVVVGVSKESHAHETFRLLREKYGE